MATSKNTFEPPPCEHCPNKTVCELAHLACERFAYYAETGRVKVRYQTVPTKAFYEGMFYRAVFRKDKDV